MKEEEEPEGEVLGEESTGNTLNSAYNEKKYAEILLCYRQLFVEGDVFISERGIQVGPA